MANSIGKTSHNSSIDIELLALEEQYRKLLDEVSDMIQIVTDGGAFLFVNRAWCENFGYDEDTIGELSLSDLMPHDKKRDYMDLFTHALLVEKIERTEIEFVTKNGNPLLVEGSITGLSKEGKLHATLSIFRDITERKKAEEALRESEARNRAIRSALPDLMFLLTRDGTFLDCHAMDERMLLAPRTEIIGKNTHNILPPQMHADLLPLFEKALTMSELQVYEYELMINGKMCHFEARIVACGEDQVLSLVRDITDRKKAEEDLLQSERRYRELVEHSMGFIFIHDLEGKILSVNPAAAKALGYAPKEMVGRSLLDFTPPSFEKILPVYLEQILAERTLSHTVKLLTKSGELRIWSYHNALQDEPNREPYILCHAQDITAMKQIEAAIRDLSLRDELTGLRNRRGFMLLAEHQLKLAQKRASLNEQEQNDLLLLYADLDSLKQINDLYGHNEGDAVIIKAAKILKKTFRDSDILARLSGDEFAVMIVASGSENEEKIEKRLAENIASVNSQSDKPYQISMSIGLVRIPSTSSASIGEFMERADTLMYENKNRKQQQQEKIS
jgi:diguanylate cyclase (GGDEF)-like protein/PAS domain S-box-containing protein